jgi:protein phosphatase
MEDPVSADPIHAQPTSEPPHRSGIVHALSPAYVTVFGLSHRGRVRSRNEDAYLVARHLSLFAVSDGMGGAAAGEVASGMTVDELRAAFDEADATNAGALPSFGQAVARANARVYALAQADSAKYGMGATLTALRLVPGGAAILHVGDSRAYRFRRGQLSQITQDHSLVAEQMRAGNMSEEEARRSPFRHIISRAIGTHSEVKADEHSVDLEPGDTLLLCTDGLHGVVDDETIARVLCATSDVAGSAANLIQAALDAGGPDNIAVVLVHFGGSISRSAAPASAPREK